LFDEESQDKRKALQNSLQRRIDAELIINVQVINEFYNVLLRKNIEDNVIQEKIHSQLEICSASELSLKTVFNAWKLKAIYKYSYWDSLILASALENSCSIIYSGFSSGSGIVYPFLYVLVRILIIFVII